MNILDIVLLLHTATTIAMGGVIWFVQVVHYPLFERVGPSGFAEYEFAHSRLTSIVVAPLMIVEAVTAVVLLFWLTDQTLLWWGIGVLVLIWVSTFVLQVPQHRKLSAGFDAAAHRRLVRTNWLRVAGWSARGVIALVVIRNAA